jgi:hypothetical protein
MTSSSAQVTVRRNTPSWTCDWQARSVQDRRVHTSDLGGLSVIADLDTPLIALHAELTDRIIPSPGNSRTWPSIGTAVLPELAAPAHRERSSGR